MTSRRKYWKIPFTLVKGIPVNNDENVCAVYVTQNTSIFKFIETDEAPVKLLHNYSKSGCHKLQKFQ